MAFAGLGPSLVGEGSICFLSGPRNRQFMDELCSEGDHAIKGIQKLETLFRSQSQTLESNILETPIKYREKVLTQWPKNSTEFQVYLQNSVLKNSPFKSSFQSSLQSEEKEKKVRFNVSHVSSVSFNSQSSGL